MDFTTLFDWFLLFLMQGVFFFSVAGCAVLAAWGAWNRSKNALWLSAALLLPPAFFLSLQPILASVDELRYWLARYTLWSSIALSPLVAVLGVWKRSRIILLMSAALSVPFGVWFFFYPGTRFYLAQTVLRLIASATVPGRMWWIGAVVLVVILALVALFLFIYSGWVTLGVPEPPTP